MYLGATEVVHATHPRRIVGSVSKSPATIRVTLLCGPVGEPRGCGLVISECHVCPAHPSASQSTSQLNLASVSTSPAMISRVTLFCVDQSASSAVVVISECHMCLEQVFVGQSTPGAECVCVSLCESCLGLQMTCHHQGVSPHPVPSSGNARWLRDL